MSTATDVYEHPINFFEAQNTSYEVDSHASGKKKENVKEAPKASLDGEKKQDSYLG